MPKTKPAMYEYWRFKPNRGFERFGVVGVTDDRVTLRDSQGKEKTISLRTLYGDYCPVPPKT